MNELPKTPYQIRLRLVQISDELLMLSEQEAWCNYATPELEELRRKAFTSADAMWYKYRQLSTEDNQNA
jgi:hypothetical protein